MSDLDKGSKKGMSPLGNRLRGLRGFRGWSQGDVAERTGLGVNTISNIERGGEPSVSTLKKLALLFGVTVDYLLEEETPEIGTAKAA